MPRKAIRRILKKKQQTKRKVKKPQQKTQQLDVSNKLGGIVVPRKVSGVPPAKLEPLKVPLVPAGFAHQQYGNPDLAIQQMRNQGQMFTDQINNYRSVSESMKRENDKLQKALKEAKKESKKAKQDLESARTDYDIAKEDLTDNENIAKKAEHLREPISWNSKILKNVMTKILMIYTKKQRIMKMKTIC